MPIPGPGEVLVRVRAVSLNFRDIAYATGRYFPNAPSGLIPVSDAAGEIVTPGGGFAVGDRVINAFNPRWVGGRYPADGTFSHEYGTAQDGWLSEYRAVPADALLPAPEGWSFEQSATLPCAATTAWTALQGPWPIAPGQTVLVQGSGTVSLFALQFAVLAGATVIATTTRQERITPLRALGAAEVIDTRTVPEWGPVVHAMAHGGVDRIVEVGGSSTFAQTLRAGSKRAEIAVIGFLGEEAWNVDFPAFFAGGYELIRRIRVGSRADCAAMLSFIGEHPLAPVIDSVHDFDDASDGFKRLADRDAFGKIIVRI